FSFSDDYPHFDEERKKKMEEEGWTLSLRQITTRDCLFSSRDLCVLSNREDIFHSRLQRCAVNVPCLSISLFSSLCPFLSVFRSALFFVLSVSFRVTRESDRL